MRLVSFDFWSTLARSNPGYKRRRIAVMGEALGTDVTAAADAADKELDEETVRTGVQYGLRDRVARTAELVDAPLPAWSGLEARLEAAFLSHPPTLTETALPDVLSALRRAGHRIAVTSNTGFVPGRLIRGALRDLGLTPYVDHGLFSDEVGAAKPSPEIFGRLLATAGVAPGEAVHIGDDRRMDVDGARAAGLHALWYRPGAEPADGLVTSHADLPTHPLLAA